MIFVRTALNKNVKKQSILDAFSEAQTTKIRWKIESKNVLFFDIDFGSFFFDFGLILGSQNHSKIVNFRENCGSKASSESLLLWKCFLDGFWGPQNSILVDFWNSKRRFGVLKSHSLGVPRWFGGWFWLRASRNQQLQNLCWWLGRRGADQWMDGWMDGWSRPNHMPSRLDALQTPTPVDSRRFPNSLHGVAKQAPFYVALQSDFGRFGRPKIDAETRFLSRFFRRHFRLRFCIDFCSISGSSKPEKSMKTMVLPMVFDNFHKLSSFETGTKKRRCWLHFRKPKRWKFEKN